MFTDNITNVQHLLVQQIDLSKIVKMINRSVFMKGHTSKDLHASTSQFLTQTFHSVGLMEAMIMSQYLQSLMPRGSRNICMQSVDTLEYMNIIKMMSATGHVFWKQTVVTLFCFYCRCHKK